VKVRSVCAYSDSFAEFSLEFDCKILLNEEFDGEAVVILEYWLYNKEISNYRRGMKDIGQPWLGPDAEVGG
jgi:hypothetical protein